MSKISPMTEAELDRIASGIRPSWELDDAPFRPAGFASPELDALLNGNGAHSVHTNGAAGAIVAQPIVQVVAMAVPQDQDLKTTVDPRPPIALVEAPIAQAPPATRPISAPPPPMAAPAVAPPAARANGVVPPAAQSDPFAVPAPWEGKAKKKKGSTSSADLAAMKKSSSGIWVALGGGVVAIGIAVYLFSGSSTKTEAPKQEPSAQQIAASAAKVEIPPPPATDEIPTAKATASPPPPETAATDLPTATTASPPPTPTQQAPQHVSHNDTPPPHHTAASHPNPPSGGGGGGKHGGGIVRDVPF